MPQVVDSDQDAEDIGLEIEGVGLPPGGEVVGCMSADAAVDKSDGPPGIIRGLHRGDNESIAVAEQVIGIFRAAPAHVCDGVALEKDSGAFLEEWGVIGLRSGR